MDQVLKLSEPDFHLRGLPSVFVWRGDHAIGWEMECAFVDVESEGIGEEVVVVLFVGGAEVAGYVLAVVGVDWFWLLGTGEASEFGVWVVSFWQSGGLLFADYIWSSGWFEWGLDAVYDMEEVYGEQDPAV